MVLAWPQGGRTPAAGDERKVADVGWGPRAAKAGRDSGAAAGQTPPGTQTNEGSPATAAGRASPRNQMDQASPSTEAGQASSATQTGQPSPRNQTDQASPSTEAGRGFPAAKASEGSPATTAGQTSQAAAASQGSPAMEAGQGSRAVGADVPPGALDSAGAALLARGRAAWVLLGLLALTVIGLLAPQTVAPATPAGGIADVELYRQIAARVAAGDAYYPTALRLQLENGYPTQPAMAVRLPTLTFVEADLGPTGITLLLGALAAAALLALLRRLELAGVTRGERVLALVLAGLNLSLVAVGSVAWFHDAWAGVLILLAFALGGSIAGGRASCSASPQSPSASWRCRSWS